MRRICALVISKLKIHNLLINTHLKILFSTSNSKKQNGTCSNKQHNLSIVSMLTQNFNALAKSLEKMNNKIIESFFSDFLIHLFFSLTFILFIYYEYHNNLISSKNKPYSWLLQMECNSQWYINSFHTSGIILVHFKIQFCW